MTSIKDGLDNLENFYAYYLNKLLKEQKKEHEGSIQYVVSNGVVQYYRCVYDKETKSTKRIYLKTEEFDLARQMAQDTYNEKALSLISKIPFKYEKPLRLSNLDLLIKRFLLPTSQNTSKTL